MAEPVNALLLRLHAGRPLLLSGDPAAELALRGAVVRDAAEIGALVRERAADVADVYHHDIGAGVDVVCSMTAETTPRALHRLGMAFRAAAITGTAVDLALDAAEVAPRPVLVAGILGSRALGPATPDRTVEELTMHATRLATAGCHVLLARGFQQVGEAGADAAHVARRAAVAAAVATGLPTWAVVGASGHATLPDGEPLARAAARAAEAGASAVLFELSGNAAAATAVVTAHLASDAGALPVGVLLAADRGSSTPDEWAATARALLDAGARAIGGGAFVTSRHVAALSASLRKGERSSLFPPAP